MAGLGRFATVTAAVLLVLSQPAGAAGFGERTSTRNPGAGGAIKLAPPPFVYQGSGLSVVRSTTVEAEAQVGEEGVNRGEAKAITNTEVQPGSNSVTQTLEVQRTVGDAQSGDGFNSATGAAGAAGMIKSYDLETNDYFSFKGFDKVSAQTDGASVELKSQKFQKTNKGP